jgi:hypothetical protein
MFTVIFAKHGKLPFIYQRGCNNYYKHLMVAPSLRLVATLTEADLEVMTQTNFDAFLKGDHVPGAAPAPPALVAPLVPDHAGDEAAYAVAEDPDDAGPVVHALPPMPSVPPPPVAAVAALMPLMPAPHRTIQLNLDGFPACHVNFDNATHNTGNARALFQGDCHGVCRIDVFLKDFPSAERAAAYLFAWRIFGEDCASKADHLARKPSDEEVDVIWALRFT